MGNAARKDDMVKHDSPHCHAPIHPAAPTPTPVAHPPVPRKIQSMCSPNVKTDGKEQAIVGSMTEQCMEPSCVPAGPGLVAMGSTSVMVNFMPAARVNDMVAFASCVAPIPSPTGKIQSPGSTTVIIGG